MRSTFWSLLVVAALLIGGGCGSSSDHPELGTVSGVVTMDGSPLAGVVVSFSPTNGRTSTGITDASGKYELTYTHDTKGAQVGEHSVHIAAQGGKSGEGGGDPNEEGGGAAGPKVDLFKGSIPPKYNQKTTLSATVVAGNNTFDFELKSD